MVDDARHYDRLPKNHADRTYDKLVEFVEAVITTKRQRHNIVERDALMSGKLKTKATAIPAAPAKAAAAPKGAGRGGAGGVSPLATATAVCRMHFTTGQCKWGHGCRFAHTAKSKEQKEAVAKFFAKYGGDSSVPAAPVTPKAKEGAPAA